MSRSSWSMFRSLLNIFCCPPLPSKITNKLAFVPPEISYMFVDSEASGNPIFRPLEKAEWQFGPSELESIEAFTCVTSRKENIACVYIRPKKARGSKGSHSKYTILFSHGNAVDLGQMSSFLTYFSNEFQMNICCYDYAGYGASSGTPSEANIYADADACFNTLVERYNLKPEQIILYGQSIGTAPTVDLASKVKVAGVVLHCPLMSGMRIAFPRTRDTWFCDAFASIDKVKDIDSPVLVIHGTEDEVIDILHGQSIFKKCPKTVTPLWVAGAGHNDIELYPAYFERLHNFFEQELPIS